MRTAKTLILDPPGLPSNSLSRSLLDCVVVAPDLRPEVEVWVRAGYTAPYGR